MLELAKKHDKRKDPKYPDLIRWLSKSSEICTHFQRIANIAISPRLTHWLSEIQGIEFVPNPLPLGSWSVTIDQENIESALKAAGEEVDLGSINEPLKSISKGLDKGSLPPNRKIGALPLQVRATF